MDARFGLQPAVGVVARDLKRCRLDPGFFARALVKPCDLVAMSLGPAHVHPQQDLRPVLGFGPAGTGVDLQETVVRVRLARQQRSELLFLRPVSQLDQGNFGFGNAVRIVLGFAEFDQHHAVLDPLLEVAVIGDRLFQMRALAHDLLRRFGRVPERGIFSQGVQFV
jgi:hypothetical protein